MERRRLLRVGLAGVAVALVLLSAALSGCSLLQSLFNRSPVAVIAASPTAGSAPLEVAFDGSGSFDPDGQIVTFYWDFADGQTSSAEIVSHTYRAQGEFTASLIVRDDERAKGRARVTISVGPPQPR